MASNSVLLDVLEPSSSSFAQLVFHINDVSSTITNHGEKIHLNAFPECVQNALISAQIVGPDNQIDVSAFVEFSNTIKSIKSGKIPLKPFPAEFQSMLQAYDVNGDGELQYEEVKQAFNALELEKHGCIRYTNYPDGMKSALKELDTDGDEILNAHEVTRGVEALLREKSKNRVQRNLLIIMSALLLICTGAICGITFAVIQLTKDSLIGNNGVMLVKGTNQPVRTASADMAVKDGVLTSLCTLQSGSECPANFTSSPIQTSAAHEVMKLTSQIDDDSFKELKQLTITQGSSFIHFQVLAVARYNDLSSQYGSVVVIYTHIGEITLDGDSMLFHETMQGAFSRAGFVVDTSTGRRLIGLVELIGFFNRINKLREVKNASAEEYTPSHLPLSFFANTSEIQRCGQRDCRIEGKLVDWISTLPDGAIAMITHQQMYSVTFDGLPYSKSTITKDQWPGQELVVLQNASHKLTLQSFQGVNYYCRLENDTSLEIDFTKRRRRVADASGGPFTFVGFETINGVFCKHFRMSDEHVTADLYEDHAQRRLYQLRWATVTVQFDLIQPIESEDGNPLVRSDFDFENLTRNCNRDDRRPPPRLVEGQLTNSLFPKPDWGFKADPHDFVALYNDSISNSTFIQGNSSSNLTYSNFTYNLTYSNQSRRHMEGSLSESWDGTIVHMTLQEFNDFRGNHRRELVFLGNDCSVQTRIDAYPPTLIIPGFLEEGSLFTMISYNVLNCDTRKIIGVYLVLQASRDAGRCMSKNGELQLYIPMAGNPRPIAIQGELSFEVSLKSCLSTVIGDILAEVLSKIFDLKAGFRLTGAPVDLHQAGCPRCGGVITNRAQNFCWLKSAEAFYPFPAISNDRVTYIENMWPWSFYDETNYPYFDLAFFPNYDSNQCRDACAGRIDCGGFAMQKSGLEFRNCWLKSAEAFTINNRYVDKNTISVVRSVYVNGRTPDYQADTDFPGYDIFWTRGTNMECTQTCAQNRDCAGFIMDSASNAGFRGQCWFKNQQAFQPGRAIFNPDRHTMLKSGYFPQRMPVISPYTAHPGWDIKDMQGSGIQCMSACKETPGCIGMDLNKRSADGFTDGHCYLKRAGAFVPWNSVSTPDWESVYIEPFVQLPSFDFPNYDLQSFGVRSASECEDRCQGFNDVFLNTRIGDFDRIPQISGQGYASVSFLNLGADVDLTLDIFLGARCGKTQADGDAMRLGMSLTAGYRVSLDFWFYVWRTSGRYNLLPPGGDPCGSDGRRYVAEDEGKTFYLFPLPGIGCSK